MRRVILACLCSLGPCAIATSSCDLSWRDLRPADAGSESDGNEGCAGGLLSCSGVCVDIAANHGNCGGCGAECAAQEVCSGGRCLTECPAGQIVCDGGCLDGESDILHCGGCETVCTAGEHADPACVSGDCGVICREGWEDRDGDGSCETSTGPVEVCNGVDDDGDTECDNGTGMACCSGEAGTCMAACGTQGTRTCLSTCVWGSCQAPAESCNGVDDDCDGTVDEGCSDPCEGHCSNGTTDCGESGEDCGGECGACSSCPPGHMGNGEHGDPCSAEFDEKWRCVRETIVCGSLVPQVCRDGIWQTYNCSARDCPNCCGDWSSACEP